MGAKLTLSGDSGGAVKAVQALQKAIEGTGKGLELTAKEAKALEVAAERITKANLAPTEKYTAKLQDLAKAVNAGKLSFEEATKAAERYGVQLEHAGKKGSETFGSQAFSEIKNYALGLVGVSTAITAIRSEFQATVEAARKVTETQLGSAESRDVLKRNIFGKTNAERAEILAGSDQIAKEVHLPQGDVDRALSQTVATRPTAKSSLDFVRFASKFSRDGETLGELSGALGDIANATGTDDPLQALGFLGIASQKGRPVELRQYAQNLPKVVQATRSAGGDPRLGAAIFDSLTIGSADVTGEQSRTAGIQLIQRVQDFSKGGSFDDNIQGLLKDPAKAKKFLKKYNFEAGVQPGVDALLLDPTSAARRTFDETYDAIGTAQTQVEAGKRGVDYLSTGKVAGTRLREQTVQSATEQYNLSKNAEFSPDRAEEIFQLTNRVVGGSQYLQRPAAYYRTGNTLSLEEAISELKIAIGDRGTAYGADPTAVPAAEQLLKDLKDIQEKQLQELQNITTNQINPARAPVGRQE